ncbi:uncharacterized protein LOC111694658 [Trichogramma pretiosum]|uniref:uncharacterized protein LOC111694658 n=1 Tax=Trichogramma pretiosum TaxID=7493 RepID=UPI000C71A3F8|nr:uncharacterized protein LOC111694658 [Trichogramma pretiosum]
MKVVAWLRVRKIPEINCATMFLYAKLENEVYVKVEANEVPKFSITNHNKNKQYIIPKYDQSAIIVFIAESIEALEEKIANDRKKVPPNKFLLSASELSCSEVEINIKKKSLEKSNSNNILQRRLAGLDYHKVKITIITFEILHYPPLSHFKSCVICT